MPTTKAKAAKGTLVQRGDGGSPSETFTTIGEVNTFSGPQRTATVIDATSFDSTWEESILGVPVGGEVTLECNLVGSNGQQQGLETDYVNGTLRNFKIVLNDHATTKTTFSFSALVTALSVQGQGPNAKYVLNCTLKISGPTTVTYAPS